MAIDPVLRHGPGAYAVRLSGNAAEWNAGAAPNPPGNSAYARTAIWVSATTAAALFCAYVVMCIWFGR